MKVKHIKKLRECTRWYDVQHSRGLFGNFYLWGEVDKWSVIRVLAKNPRQACVRAKRRGVGLDYRIADDPTDVERFAHWKVKESGKSSNFRHTLYF